jgi:sugar transferase (PEP-CTERM/EpsH1 system associated)
MRELLFLSHRLPYPPTRGDKIRSWHILRHLARNFRVHVGCFVDDPDDRRNESVIRQHCDEACFVRLDRRIAMARALRTTIAGRPFTLGYYEHAGLAAWVRGLVARRPIDVVFAFSSSMAPYAMAAGTAVPCRIADLVDVDSDKWRQYAARKPWPTRNVFAREARTLLQFERQVACEFSVVLLVSEPEAQMFAQLAPESRTRIHWVRNGVDAEYFSPLNEYPNPYPPDVTPIVLTGAMDYWPNIDAAVWFTSDILPHIRGVGAPTRFYVVGSNPAPVVRRLRHLAPVTVTGRVADVRPYLAHAAAAVAPMRVARGIQNKILEAMAMARVVVTTSQGLEGIAAEPDRHLRVADSAHAFAQAVSRAIVERENETLGSAARQLILDSYHWDETLKALDDLLAGTGDALTASRSGEASSTLSAATLELPRTRQRVPDGAATLSRTLAH